MSRLVIDHVETSGLFSLDNQTWEVENNIWITGNDSEVIIIDAAHNADPIIAAVGERKVIGIICTHAHDDHITCAPALSKHFSAPIFLHPADRVLWDKLYPEVEFDPVKDHDEFPIGDTYLQVIHTPGHSPGSICLHAPQDQILFSGDTLFRGGPGATGRSYSSFPQIVSSIQDLLFALPPQTSVYPGHGISTSIGIEASYASNWNTADQK